jgi:hypothetical protein
VHVSPSPAQYATTLVMPSGPLVPRELSALDLYGAADLLEARGLERSRYHNPLTGCMCPLGALLETIVPGFWTNVLGDVYVTTERKHRYWSASQALGNFLDSVALNTPTLPTARITRWVEKPTTSPEAVLAAMRETARQLSG